MMKLNVSHDAIDDIIEIKKYISEELCNPAAARRVADKIIESYKSLKHSAFIGVSLNSVIGFNTDYRFLVCDNYLIFYKVIDETVYVHRIISGRRDYSRILFNKNFTEISEDTFD